MKALEIGALQGPQAARITDRPTPEPQQGEVLLRVLAAGLNFADVAQSRGQYVGGPRPPYVAGFEACGEVVSCGPGVDVPVGSRWLGTGNAAFAEYVAWPAARLMPLPKSWSPNQGAAFFVQWLTAHGCLRTVGRLATGESVLIHAAAGGVGTAAVRLAKHFGARVFATASSSDKLELARRNGADVLIKYTTEDFVAVVRRETEGRGVDLILEMAGGETFRRNLQAVRPFGRIVVFGAASGEIDSVDARKLIFEPIELIGYHLGVLTEKRPDLFGAEIREVQSLIASGVITPDEPHVYPLTEGANALADLEGRRTTGKLVLVP